MCEKGTFTYQILKIILLIACFYGQRLDNRLHLNSNPPQSLNIQFPSTGPFRDMYCIVIISLRSGNLSVNDNQADNYCIMTC